MVRHDVSEVMYFWRGVVVVAVVGFQRWCVGRWVVRREARKVRVAVLYSDETTDSAQSQVPSRDPE